MPESSWLEIEILFHREPIPAPIKISPWLAMSLLQKSIRRGESEVAQRAHRNASKDDLGQLSVE
jgi:hypothetical protein